MKATALVLVILLLAAIGIWAWVAAPCEIYSWSKAGEIPARCVMHR